MCFNKSQKKIKFDFVFVDEEDIRFLEEQNTLLQNNSVVELVPAISGG